jgi:subtilisin family serine protease
MKSSDCKKKGKAYKRSNLVFQSFLLLLLLSLFFPLSGVAANSKAKQHPLKEMLEEPGHGGTKAKHAPGEILLKLRKESAISRQMEGKERLSFDFDKGLKPAESQDEFQKLLSKYSASSMERALKKKKGKRSPLSFSPAEAAKEEALSRWYRLNVASEVDIEEAAKAFKKNFAVEYAEPNYKWKLADLPSAATDPGYAEQWHLLNTKTTDTWLFLSNEGIHPGGLRSVTVAVIDTGVDYTHQDLAGNMWVNGGEIPGNGIDDDGNGFVDDIHGCSVVYGTDQHSGNPMDLSGHGTHVAGIVAATAFNQAGGVGVAFNCQIMGIRAAQESGVISTQDIAEGVLYAVDNGADVINMSFGGYARSQIVEDALAIALSQAVLVASAGNQSKAAENEPDEPYEPMYPAALPWVLGVMASDQDGMLAFWSNYDTFPDTRYNYEIAAPGTNIYSTWPGNRYAHLSGTSMSAPVISGMAALLRSYFSDSGVYSSRFIMGQIVGGRADILWETLAPGERAPVVDAQKAVSQSPTPGVSMSEHWTFDTNSISPSNNGDGRISAGETIHLGVKLMNRAGRASNVQATLSAPLPGMGSDPYVNISTNTVTFSDIGAFAEADNGFIYDQNGVLIGFEHPFVFTVDPNCPNDHVIAFTLTVTYRNGWDPEDLNVYTHENQFELVVHRGRLLPSVISADMDWLPNELWIVGGPVLIESGVTVTVHPGTQVQFGSVSDDPYNPGPKAGYIIVRGTFLSEGTLDRPISLVPSPQSPGPSSAIIVEGGGTAKMKYTKARNPWLGYNSPGFNIIDHCYFDYDAYGIGGGAGVNVVAKEIGYTIFHKIAASPTTELLHTCLFDPSLAAPPGYTNLFNNVFLQDNENDTAITLKPLVTTATADIRVADFTHVQNITGRTYALYYNCPWLRLLEVEAIAKYFGGHVISIPDANTQAFVQSYLATAPSPPSVFVNGLHREGFPRDWAWIDGTPLTYTNWGPGCPNVTWESMTVWHSAGGHYVVTGAESQWCNYPEIDGRVHFGFILDLPGVWTEEQLDAALQTDELINFINLNHPGYVRYNAFLSKYWDVNVNHWLRIEAQGGSYTSLVNNFWGTTSTTLIDHLITDYYDNFSSSRVVYGTPPEHGFPSTYPFVEQVFINSEPAQTIPVVGAGEAIFTVKFNRDMDMKIHPFVTFGPAIPYTDFRVKPVGNGWLDSKTWQGSAQITPVTGDGYHLMRISGAVAADDPWLVSGNDVARFRFQVKTMGVAAMTLQATGVEGAVQLSWQQNDYALLAGYNLYRSTSLEGSYIKLNQTLIPAGRESFSDSNLTPAVPMYYKFTVVTTDLAESEFSNIASAAAVDTIPPLLSHVAVTEAPAGRSLRLAAKVSDNVSVKTVVVHYRPLESGFSYLDLPMARISGDDWSVSIPGTAVLPPGIEYYITATDGITQIFTGTPALPHAVVVTNEPALTSVSPNHGSSGGGTPVNLTGTLFQEGASVLFGGVLAGNIVVVSENQITCITPPHDPALVDVTVRNSDDTESTLVHAFTFEDQGVVVSLPGVSGNYGSFVDVGLSAVNVTGLRAADVEIQFDPNVLRVQSINSGTLTAGWSLTANTSTPGRLILSLASATSVTGSGTLAQINFEVLGNPSMSTPLTIKSAVLNDGAIAFESQPGQFVVNGFFNLSGTVSYFGGGVVSGVSLSLTGTGMFQAATGETGQFSFADIPTGSYTLTPTKGNGAAEITAYDASLVLQSAVGLITLSEAKRLAADVNKNASVTSMDAAYILEHAVGLSEMPFQGAGRVWDFLPSSRSYSLMNAHLTGQDFTAILIGDVSGNWTPTGGIQDIGQCTLSVPRIIVPPGAEIVYPISLSIGEESVYSADITVTFDPSVISPVSPVSKGQIVRDTGAILESNLSEPGTIRIGLASATAIQQSGELLQITFAAVGEEGTASDVTFTEGSLNEGRVSAVLTNGYVTVKTVLKGDVNGDSIIDLADAILCLKMMSGKASASEIYTEADVNGDGKIGLAEVLYILQKAAGAR